MENSGTGGKILQGGVAMKRGLQLALLILIILTVAGGCTGGGNLAKRAGFDPAEATSITITLGKVDQGENEDATIEIRDPAEVRALAQPLGGAPFLAEADLPIPEGDAAVTLISRDSAALNLLYLRETGRLLDTESLLWYRCPDDLAARLNAIVDALQEQSQAGGDTDTTYDKKQEGLGEDPETADPGPGISVPSDARSITIELGAALTPPTSEELKPLRITYQWSRIKALLGEAMFVDTGETPAAAPDGLITFGSASFDYRRQGGELLDPDTGARYRCPDELARFFNGALDTLLLEAGPLPPEKLAQEPSWLASPVPVEGWGLNNTDGLISIGPLPSDANTTRDWFNVSPEGQHLILRRDGATQAKLWAIDTSTGGVVELERIESTGNTLFSAINSISMLGWSQAASDSQASEAGTPKPVDASGGIFYYTVATLEYMDDPLEVFSRGPRLMTVHFRSYIADTGVVQTVASYKWLTFEQSYVFVRLADHQAADPVAVLQAAPGLWQVNLRSGEATLLTSGLTKSLPAYIPTLRWTPDRTIVAWLQRTSASMKLIDTLTGDTWDLLFPEALVSGLLEVREWSDNGRHLVVGYGDEENVHSVENGSAAAGWQEMWVIDRSKLQQGGSLAERMLHVEAPDVADWLINPRPAFSPSGDRLAYAVGPIADGGGIKWDELTHGVVVRQLRELNLATGDDQLLLAPEIDENRIVMNLYWGEQGIEGHYLCPMIPGPVSAPDREGFQYDIEGQALTHVKEDDFWARQTKGFTSEDGETYWSDRLLSAPTIVDATTSRTRIVVRSVYDILPTTGPGIKREHRLDQVWRVFSDSTEELLWESNRLASFSYTCGNRTSRDALHLPNCVIFASVNQANPQEPANAGTTIWVVPLRDK